MAPAAPIGAELNQNSLVFFFRSSHRLFELVLTIQSLVVDILVSLRRLRTYQRLGSNHAEDEQPKAYQENGSNHKIAVFFA
jgi:hypothetical protein